MIKKYAQDIAVKYLANPEQFDVRSEMKKIASSQQMNNHQLDYFTGEVNTAIITGIQAGIPTGQQDPHFYYDTIKTAELIEKDRQMASPTLPDKQRVMPTPFVLPMEAPDDGYEQRKAASDLRHEIDLAKRALAKEKYQLDSMKVAFKTKLNHEIVSGTPIEVLALLPLNEEVIEVASSHKKYASLGHFDFEPDIDHPLFKLAYDIMDARARVGELESDLSRLNELDKARRRKNALISRG